MQKETVAKQYVAIVGLLAIAWVVFQQQVATFPVYQDVSVWHSEDASATDFCSLPYVDCATKPKRTVRATVTTYQAVAAQTDATPCQGAMAGINFCNPPYPIVAANGWKLGTKVRIRGVVYVVSDRMNSRYGSNRFDILTQGQNWTWQNERVEVL